MIRFPADIQGLIALEDAPQSRAVHILWAVAVPQNNVYRYGKKLYAGVGGHLFAIAGNRSDKLGYGGLVYGEAMDQEIMDHYIANYGAEFFPFLKNSGMISWDGSGKYFLLFVRFGTRM